MKCPNCGKDGMVESRAGWLCLSCGHLKRNEPTSTATQIATGKDAHAQMRTAITGHDIHKTKHKPEAPAPAEAVDAQPEPVMPPPPSAVPPWAGAPVESAETDPPKGDDTAQPETAPEPMTPGAAELEPESKPEPKSKSEDDHADEAPEPVKESEPVEEAPAPEQPDEAEEPEPPPLPAAPTEPEQPDPAAGLTPDAEGAPKDAPKPPEEEAKPTPEKLVAEATPGVPAPATLPLNGKPPLQPVTHPRPIKPAVVVKLVLGFAAVAVIAGASFLYLYQPNVALAGYLKRLSAAKTGSFAATANGQASGYRFALKVDVKANLTNQTKPSAHLTASGTVSPIIGTAEAGSLSASLTVTDGTAYVKAENVPAQLLLGAVSSDWQKYSPASGLGQCLGSGKGLGSVIANAGDARPPVTAASFAGLDTLYGAQALHYKGSFDRAKLQTYLDTITKDLAPNCKADVSHLAVAYELWQGMRADRLKLTFTDTDTNATTEIVIDSNSYNQPVNIQAPSVSKPASPSPSAGATSKTAAPIAGARDTQRKADLAAYIAAYKAVAVNGFYPIEPPVVGISAKDPSTAKPYVISKLKSAALGQIEYRPGGACTGAGITPGATGSRYLAIFTSLEDGQTACADNR